MSVTLEFVEGPEAGRQIEVDRELVFGRDASADIVLADGQVSRRHARVRSEAGGLTIEDLESSNGTFINGNEVHGPAKAVVGDELQLGVTVLQVHAGQVTEQHSAVRNVPPSLAMEPRRPTYVPQELASAAPVRKVAPELERLRDSRTKGAASVAPFAILALVALAIVIYLGAT